MASLSNRVSLDTNVIFLRSIFAFSTNNIPVSTNYIMAAGANGQVYAQDTLRNIEAYGVGYLPSTFSTLEGEIYSTGQELFSGSVTAEDLTSTQNYLLSTICTVNSNVANLSTGISSILASSFASYDGQISSLNSSFVGYVVGTAVTGTQLNSTTTGILTITSTNTGTLSNYGVATYTPLTSYSNLSTGVSTQSNYFSVQVVQLSNNFTALSNYTRINLSNQSTQISTITSQVNTFSTLLSGFSSAVTITAFQGLSTYVLEQSTTIRSISDSLSTNWSNTSNVSTYVIALSTSVGTRFDSGGGGSVTAAEFQGLSTFVLGQSTTIRSISDSLSTNWSNTSNVSTYVVGMSTTLGNVSNSLSTNWSNTSNVSTYVVALSTSVGTRFDSGGGGSVTAAEFQGLSTFVLGQSTTIRNISDSLSTNWSNTSNVSTYVVTLSTSVGNRFATIGSGGTTISTNILYGTSNTNASSNTLVGGSNNVTLAINSAIVGVNNRIELNASNSFACGENNIINGANNIISGIGNDFDNGVAFSMIVGKNNYTSASGSLAVGFYTKARIPGSIVTSGIGPLYNGVDILSGYAQTYTTTLLSRTASGLGSNDFRFFTDKNNTAITNMRFGNDGINGNFLTGVKLDVYGYEGSNLSAGSAGDGFYYATYEYGLYRDTATGRNYVCDIIANTRTPALVSPTAVQLTASRTVNFLKTSPAVQTISIFVVMLTPDPSYYISITNNNPDNGINFIARLQATDILQGRSS